MGLLGWLGLACVIVVIILVCKIGTITAWIVSSIANKARQAREERKWEREIRREERQLKREMAEHEEKAQKVREEEQRRKNTICKFSDGISQELFESIVKSVTDKVNRIRKATVEGAIIYCAIRSQSELSEWYCIIDFNDYGHLTGRYWIATENLDSKIPDTIADNIRRMIQSHLDNQLSVKEYNSSATNETCFCPNCGKKLSYRNPKFCCYCGTQL